MKKIFILLSVLFYAQSASAILDGRTAPIYLDTRYTFTNYEWARGIVFFNDGFDVAPGGTIFLGMQGGEVQNNIELNGGTVCLEQVLNLGLDGHITGSGFIDGNSQQINFWGVGHDLFENGTYIKFISPIRLNGQGASARLDPDQVLDFRGVAGDIHIDNMRVTLRGARTLTDATTPHLLRFNNCTVVQNTKTTFSNPEVILADGTRLVTKNIFLTIENLLSIGGAGLATISSGGRVRLGGLNLPFENSLEIRNSIFDFTSTETFPIRIGHPRLFQGSISFAGESIFRSSTNNELRVDPSLDLEFLSGSRLILDEGVHLTIE